MATDFRKIETPFGSKVGMIWEKLEILGVSSYLTQTLTQPNDNFLIEEYVDINVPPGTLAIVPTPNFWFLGHGSLSPDKIDPLDENGQVTWHSNDRPWGLGWVQVSVVDVNEADDSTNPPTQTAQLLIVMHLCDYNMDDKWFGTVGYTLTFLGKSATGAGTENRAISPAPAARRSFKWERRKVG